MLSNVKVSWKILGLVILMLTAAMAVNGYGILQLQSIGAEIEDIAEQDIPVMEKITSITVHQLEQAILLERGLSISKDLAADPSQLSHFIEVEKKFIELGHKVTVELRKRRRS